MYVCRYIATCESMGIQHLRANLAGLSAVYSADDPFVIAYAIADHLRNDPYFPHYPDPDSDSLCKVGDVTVYCIVYATTRKYFDVTQALSKVTDFSRRREVIFESITEDHSFLLDVLERPPT